MQSLPFTLPIHKSSTSTAFTNAPEKTNISPIIIKRGTGRSTNVLIEEKISLGHTSVRIITNEDPAGLVTYLRSQNYGVTVVDGKGAAGQVKIIITIIRRQDLSCVVDSIKTFNPGAFYSVEDVKSVSEGVFPEERRWLSIPYSEALRFFRKGK
jgi:uncharacterized protein YebE (UPF0316 family)